MAVASGRPAWLPPMLALAALGGAVPPMATGALLMQDIRPGNFCNETAKVDTERALHDAQLRQLHERSALPVGGCVAIAVAFGGAAGASFVRRWRRWLVAVLAVAAIGGYLAAQFTGKKEAWHTLSPALTGWTRVPMPPGTPELGISVTHPECAPEVRAALARRVTRVYWAHVAVGALMAAAAVTLSMLGLGWRREGENNAGV